MTESLIKLTLINGKVFCFKPEDYFKIRYEYRVIGNLVGASAAFPRDLNYKALPATFMDCEAKLLVDKNFVKIVQKSSLHEKPTQKDQELFQRLKNQQQSDLKSAEVERGLELFQRNLPQILKGQKRKRPNITEEELIEEQKTRIASTPLVNSLIQVPVSNFLESSEIECQIEPQDPLKYRVFRDMWEKGFTLTGGETFGGDFLAYPGDPLHYHASQIIICKDRKALNMSDMVQYSRSSVIVNKKCVFVKEIGNELNYETVEWINPWRNLNNKIEKKSV